MLKRRLKSTSTFAATLALKPTAPSVDPVRTGREPDVGQRRAAGGTARVEACRSTAAASQHALAEDVEDDAEAVVQAQVAAERRR